MNDKANLIAGLMSRPPRQQTTHNLQPQQHHHQAGRTRSKANTKPTGNLLDSMMLGPECHRATSGSSGRTTAASSGSMATGGGVTRQHKLKQRFTVIRKLGKGTYGKVQLAINKETGQEVAIKTIKKTKIETDQDLQRVRREIQIMSSIEHPHIIHIYEVFENKDKIVLVMQYAPGGELYEYVSQSKVLDDNEARRLFRQIATAIFYCHQNKICHRDLKLENILLDEKNNAKLADFGLSNVFDKRRQLKTFCGSPLYASPEIVRGLPYEGPEVDCWSLGVLLYTLVYGAMPFDGSNFKRLVKQISEATYYEPKQKSQASHLIHRLLCANPLERANILEICSDPWVNGALVPMSPRLPLQQREDSNQIQQQHQPQSHNSLLKVAQDMANLTPVRLDILLALRPESPVSMPDEQLPPICQRKSKTPERPPPPQRNSRNELDPQIMQMYQQRQTSPVASYVVLDLDSSKSSTTRMDTSGISNNEESAAMDSEMGVEPKVELVESATELAVENDGPPKKELEIKLVDETSEQSPSHQKIEEHDGLESREATRIEGPMALETKQEVIQEPQVTETKVVAMEVDKMPTENIAQIQDTEKIETKTDDKGVEEGGEDDEEGAESRPETSSQLLEVPIMTDAEVSQESSATSPVPASEEATSGDNAKTTKPQGESATTDGSATDKPKKMVKKKVVVVKRVKKKAAKKDGETIAATGDSKEAPEVQDNSQSLCAEQPAGNEHQPEASQSSETSATATAKANPKTVKVVKRVKGPGKVKIPSTFSETQAPVQAEQTPNPESRRQSTLVADVTEKLLQHRQSVSPGASAAAVLIDQPQLVNVRVSDKKDEFERRASLMAAGELAALNSDTRSGRGSIAGQQSEHENENEQDQVVEPSIGVYGMKTTVNSVSFESISSQEVEKLKPLDPPDDLKKTCQRQQSRRSSRQRLSIDGQPRDERSDSAETIKPEESPTRLKQPTIRSTLKIDLSGAQQQQQQPHQLQLQDQATGDRFSESMGSRAVASGPAPIARSYKKVTFTKDGACITETGKIYSSKNDDGTIRRIERKSKVTHYPSDSNDSISPLTGMPHRREEIQEEEEEVILEGDDFQQQPGGWSKKPHHQQHHRQLRSSFVTTSQSGTPIRQPFERLIMPSSDLLGQDEFSCNLDERNSTFAPPSRRSPFPRHPQHQQHGHQQPTHHQSMSRADSASSCSSGSTDIFDDIFDTWTGAISMFNQGRRSSRDRSSAGIGFNNPLQDPFGQSMFATLRRRRKPSGSSRRSHGFGGGSSGGFSGSTVNGAPRCESVEPQVTGSAGHRSESPLFFPQQEVRHNHHGHQQARRRQASGSHNGRFGGEPTTSGYESDSLPPAFERPASALGSARGPTFGSSNLAAGSDPFAPLTGENPFGLDFEPIGHSLVGAMRMDPFGSNLARDLEIEHENMRRRLMQQHRQIWRGSTPSLFSDASGGGRGHQSAQVSSGPPAWQQQQQRQRQQPTSSTSSNLSQQMRQRSSTSSSQPQAQTHRQPQPQQQQQYQPAMSQSSSGLLRQSIALDPAPNRKPTNRGDEHLPPRLPPNTMRKSVSRTSIITNQLANIQFVPDESSNYSIQQVAAGPPRASASKQVVSFIELKRTSSSSSKLNLGQQPQQQPQVSQSLIGSTSRLATSTSGTSSAFWEGRVSPVIMDPSASMATSKHQVITTSESIVSIQQQHQQQQQQQQQQDQGRSLETEEDNNARENRDSRIQNWLQESAGNLSTSSGFKSSASDTGPGGCSGSRCGQLENQLGFKTTSFSLDCPPQGETPQRVSSPSGSNRMGQEKFLTESVSEEMRSSDDAGVSEAIKTTRATLTLSSPSPQAPSSETRVVHHHILEQQQVVDPQTQPQQQQPVGSSPPSSLVRNTEGLHWIQAMDSNSRLFGGAGGSDDLDGADSLSGGGSADLESSSSLLDQLRSRGYRSMINQRLVAQSGEQPQQQQHQHQRQQVITSSTTSVAADNGGRFITTTTLTTSGITTTNIQLPEQSGESASEEVQSKLDGQFADSNESPHTKPGDNPLDANSNSDQREPQSDQSNGAETNHSNAETCQSQSNGQAATSAERNEENEDDEDDDDVDIKRAKANIKGYLERMKETENFLKSIQEAESKFEHQRQQMLLLDNLFMSTKLNGINRCPGNYMSNYSLVDDPKPGIRVPQTAPINWSPHGSETMMTSTMNGMSSIPASMSTSTTAPISASDSNGYMSNAFHSNAFEPTPSSCGSGSLGSSYNMFSTLQNQRPRNGHLSSPAPGERMMSMAMPGPVAPATGGYSPFNHDLNIYRAPNYHEHDPLEPVRPLVSSGIYPKAQFMAERPANYRRSKSQLSDQFTYYKSRRPNFMSRQVEPTISRELDFSSNTFSPSSPATSMSSMPSVATSHRRATSQIRFPSMTSTTCSNASPSNRYSQPAMLSEYQAAYGPSISRQSRATSQLRASSPRLNGTGIGDIDLAQATNGGGRDSCDSGHDDNGSEDEMSSYRPSNYVPKVVPEYPVMRKARPSRDYRRRSVLRDSSPVINDSRSSQRRTSLQNYSSLGPSSNSRASGGAGLDGKASNRRSSPESTSKPATRASWRSTLKELSSPPTISRDSSPVATRSSASRRRSSGATLVGESVGSLQNLENSRLSELEQRIKANQKRREQMLMGRYSPMPDPQPTGTPSRVKDEPANKEVKVSE